ncbi:head-tail joining protein [Shimia aestuarii]|uniref:head-tail joining protein n=1 Tax=Shimia aestuarii TaxID=254406 RepID=UPI001FB215D7|nr:hypothetical protein [Shimia aestuarii]
MTSVFDGMAGALNATFGALVQHTPSGGEAVEIRAIFREQPIEVPDEDGRNILTVAPVLRVQRPVADGVSRDDVIEPGDGESYRVLNALTSGSPAADAFVLFQLERIS